MRKPDSASPKKMPISGMIVTHFSFGSFTSSQGRSISPFLILLDRKYLGWSGCWKPVVEPRAEAGIEPYGEAKGFGRGVGSIRSLSGVPGRGVPVAVVLAVPWW